MSAFPLTPTPFSGRPRPVPAASLLVWLRHGWEAFLASPGPWVAFTGLLLLALFALQFVPPPGSLVAALFAPPVAAVLMNMAATADEESLGARLTDLACRLRRSLPALFALGLVCMAGWATITVVVALITGSVASSPTTGIDLTGVLLAAVLKLLLGLPLCFALWLAPALVHFNGLGPIAALHASFSASLMNWPAMLLFVPTTLLLALLALLPAGLGLLVLVPVLAGALHAARQDIFLG